MQCSAKSLLSLAASCGIASAAAAGPANYAFAWQEPYGGPATFYTVGSATGVSGDGQGDAFLESVIYADGSTFLHYNPIVGLHDVTFSVSDSAYWSKFRAWAGNNCTVGYNFGLIELNEIDGNAGNVTQADKDGMATLALQLIRGPQLNNYFGSDRDNGNYEMTIEYKHVIRDNDPGPDEIGELLYFERGSSADPSIAGNSWLKMRAVDENGVALGPWLVISPEETLMTTPITHIKAALMGTIAIDISRLGVTELKYLQVSSDMSGQSEYTGGGDQNPDFKIWAVFTNEAQLTELGLTCD